MSEKTTSSYNQSCLPLLQKLICLDSIANDKWNEHSTLYLPKGRQILIENGGAESIAALIYLESLNINYNVEFKKNVSEMSPSGKGPLLKYGKFSIGEFSPIVDFCNLKNKGLLLNEVDLAKKNQLKSFVLLINKTYSDVLSFFTWKDQANRKIVYEIYQEIYPWPLNLILYFNEYNFNRNKLQSSLIWSKSKEQVLAKFFEINESLDRKLAENHLLIDNKLSEADILLYSYLKVIESIHQFQQIKSSLNNLENLKIFYINLEQTFGNFLSKNIHLN